jgi:hypothetical protein
MSGLICPQYRTGFYAPKRGGVAVHPQLWRSCVGSWSPCLGPTGLTLRDWSVFKNHGTLQNKTAEASWVRSAGSYALDFDGTDDNVSLTPISQYYSAEQQALSFWVRLDSLVVANRPAVFTLGQSASPFIQQFFCGWNLFGTSPTNGTSSFTVGSFQNGNPVRGAYTTATFGSRLSEWIHFFCGYDGLTWRIFVNGTEDTNAESSGPPFSTSSAVGMYFGANANATARFLDGQLDDIRFYRRWLRSKTIGLLAERRGNAHELDRSSRSSRSSSVIVRRSLSSRIGSRSLQ